MKKCCVLEYVVLKTKTNWTEIRRYKPGYDSHVIAVKLFLADAVCLLCEQAAVVGAICMQVGELSRCLTLLVFTTFLTLRLKHLPGTTTTQ